MAEIKLGGDYVKQAFTQVDNLFLSGYLASANGDDVKIYLAGLMLATTDGDCDFIPKIAALLKLPENRVADGFGFWGKQGLVE